MWERKKCVENNIKESIKTCNCKEAWLRDWLVGSPYDTFLTILNMAGLAYEKCEMFTYKQAT